MIPGVPNVPEFFLYVLREKPKEGRAHFDSRKVLKNQLVVPPIQVTR